MKKTGLKIAALGIISAALAAGFAYFLERFLSVGNWNLFFTASAFGVFWLVAFSLKPFFVVNFWAAAGLTLAEVLVLIIAPAMTGSSFAVGAGAIAAVFVILVLAYHSAVREIGNSFQLRFSKIGAPVIAKASTALAIFITAVYLGSVNFKDPAVSKEALRTVLKPAEPMAAKFIKGFNLESSLNNLAFQLMPPELAGLPAEIKAAAAQKISDQLGNTLGKTLGVRIRPQDKLIDIIYQATIGKLMKLSPAVRTAILVGIGFLIFVTIKSFLFIVNWPAAAVGSMAFGVLRSAGFYKIILESRSKEVVAL